MAFLQPARDVGSNSQQETLALAATGGGCYAEQQSCVGVATLHASTAPSSLTTPAHLSLHEHLEEHQPAASPLSIHLGTGHQSTSTPHGVLNLAAA